MVLDFPKLKYEDILSHKAELKFNINIQNTLISHATTTQEELERALKGKFVSCNVQYRDEKTDALVCNVFVQKPPEGF